MLVLVLILILLLIADCRRGLPRAAPTDAPSAKHVAVLIGGWKSFASFPTLSSMAKVLTDVMRARSAGDDSFIQSAARRSYFLSTPDSIDAQVDRDTVGNSRFSKALPRSSIS